MTLLHQAAQKAVEALTHVTTSETFFRDPRGDRAGPAIDALESALQQQPEPVALSTPRCPLCGGSGYGHIEMPPALQQQEVPREPVAQIRDGDLYWLVAGNEKLPEGALLYASPSTTQQQEAGNALMPGAVFAWNCLEATANRIRDEEARNMVRDFLMRAWHYNLLPALAASPSTPESAEKDDAGGGNGSTELIAAADRHADNYDGQDIPERDVRAAITNAFYAGAHFAARGDQACDSNGGRQ